MRFADILMTAATAPAGAPAGVSPANAWAAAVVINGGTVSAPRLALMEKLFADLNTAGTLSLYDDIFLYAAENEASALTSLKRRVLGSVVAAPTFTADRQYAFNGTTQYGVPGFTASTDAVAMTGSNMRIAAYERTNLNSTGYTAGAFQASTSNLRLRARNNTDAGGGLNSISFVLSNADSSGMVALSRTAAGVVEGWYRGASLGTVSPATGTSLPAYSLCIGAQNVAGTIAFFRAASVALVTVGASFSAAQEAADYTIWQDYMTAIGAQV